MANRNTSKKPKASKVRQSALGVDSSALFALARRLIDAVLELKLVCIELSRVAGDSCEDEYDDRWQRTLLELLEGHPSNLVNSDETILEWVTELAAEGKTATMLRAALAEAASSGARRTAIRRMFDDMIGDGDSDKWANNTNGALKCCYSTSLWPAKMLVYSKRSRFRLIFPSGSS